MAVKVRLARAGAKKHPIYRVVVADERCPRDGRFIEHIGQYNPTKTPAEFKVDADRLAHWLGCGAQPSETVRRLLLKQQQEAARAPG